MNLASFASVGLLRACVPFFAGEITEKERFGAFSCLYRGFSAGMQPRIQILIILGKCALKSSYLITWRAILFELSQRLVEKLFSVIHFFHHE